MHESADVVVQVFNTGDMSMQTAGSFGERGSVTGSFNHEDVFQSTYDEIQNRTKVLKSAIIKIKKLDPEARTGNLKNDLIEAWDDF